MGRPAAGRHGLHRGDAGRQDDDQSREESSEHITADLVREGWLIVLATFYARTTRGLYVPVEILYRPVDLFFLIIIAVVNRFFLFFLRIVLPGDGPSHLASSLQHLIHVDFVRWTVLFVSG